MRSALILSFLLAPSLVAAQNARPQTTDSVNRRVAQAVRRSGPVAIDGRLDEAAWAAAQPTSGFTQSYPTPGAAPVDPTEVRVLYDDQALYVGVRMHDSHPDSIAAQLARRDASGIYSDWVHLIIDSYRDRRTAFRFTVNPKGVKKDVYTSNDGNEDANWDAVWDVGTSVDSGGWTAEYRIPLSQVRFGGVAKGTERVWGFQVMRDIARRQARDSWSPWDRRQGAGFVSRFGDLRGLIDIPSPSRLEVLPYVSASATRAPGDASDPFYSKTDFKPNVGGDLKYGLPGGLTLSATINPDFGQVEVDPSVVNLSAFETFFPEKRPFFLEGADVFNFGRIRAFNDYGSQQYFYSRRIGRSPQRFPSSSDIVYTDVPNETTIAAAAKVSGKVGRWTVGVIDGVTPEEKADVELAGGDRSTTPVEPLTNYFAGRAKRDFRNGQSVLGGMVTSTIRRVDDDVFNGMLRSNATFGGLDFEHTFANRGWVTSGFLGGSHVTGSKEAVASTQLNSSHYYQRPDADYLEFDPDRTSLDGHIGEIALQKNGALHGSLAYKEVSPGLELNDMGFQGRGDYRALSILNGFQQDKAGKNFRDYLIYWYANQTWNFGGTSIYRSLNGGAEGTLSNFWYTGLNWGVNPRFYDDRFTRGGPEAQVPAGYYAGLNVSSDSRKPIIVGGGFNYSADEAGGRGPSANLSLDWRPTSSVRIRFNPNWSGGMATGQFVRSVADPLQTQTYGRRYVFADIHQNTIAMDTRVEWTFTPALSLQLYAQPFVATGRYENFKEFEKPRTYDFAIYGRDQGTITRNASGSYTVDPDGTGPAPTFQIGDPNFNVRNLRGNAVVRWEYRPGSALFFVWQQERSGFAPIGDFRASRDIGDIFNTVPTNVFLVKATYWLGR
jgi:hypothetical protein